MSVAVCAFLNIFGAKSPVKGAVKNQGIEYTSYKITVQI